MVTAFRTGKQQLAAELAGLSFEHVDAPYRWNFLMAAASRDALLPGHDLPEAEFYRRVHFHRGLAMLDRQFLPERIQTDRITGWDAVAAHLRRTPVVFCSLHLGSFHAFAAALLQKRVPVTVAINPSAFSQVAGAVSDDLRRAAAYWGVPMDIELLQRPEDGSALPLIRRLKAGRCLFMYMDGPLPAGSDTAVIPFLSGSVLADTGVTRLAMGLGAGLVPVSACWDHRGQTHLEFHDPLAVHRPGDSRTSALRLTEQLFDRLATPLRKHPCQWEGWLYIYQRVVWPTEPVPCLPVRIARGSAFVFNSARYGLLANRKGQYLFDKRTGKMRLLAPELYRLLAHAAGQPGMLHCGGRLSVPLAELLMALCILLPSPYPSGR